MKIALIGYGAMGRLIESLAKEQGHEITVICGSECAGESASELAKRLRGVDVAIDFSVAEAVRRNIEACIEAGIALVEGTTGWQAERPKIERFVRERMGAVVYGANFSIGVNLFFRIVGSAACLLAKFPEFEVFIEEQHHSRKKDAPSGTALKLKEIVEKAFSENSAQLANGSGDSDADKSTIAGKSVSGPESIRGQIVIPIASTRAGSIPGTHRVGFDGPSEQILIEHTARSRDGFARGAIIAAEWIIGKVGFYEFSDLMDEFLVR
jgi:4-hydroxy-tetrahydrodipicolinate reductase